VHSPHTVSRVTLRLTAQVKTPNSAVWYVFPQDFLAKIHFFASLGSVRIRLSENEGVQIFQPLIPF